MVDPMPDPDDCFGCAALREENARLKAIYQDACNAVAELTRERDEARDEAAALKTDNYRINKHRDELEVEVARLEGLILAWSNDCTTDRWPEAALEAEARRIRAQREEGRVSYVGEVEPT